ncbi:MAG: zinc ribbon domain-containing protein [Deltaproteobacteria bacterium]|nr:MAG: zinc ribbon domain-containing protein [Deltaproteobacteria bacterium]
MATYEMFWDCPACGTTKLLGKTHRHCPSCGAAQDPERRYFPAEHEKVAVEDHVFVGRDLVCAHCETPNSAIAKHCVNCGAAIGDGDDVGVVLVHERDGSSEAPSEASGATSSSAKPEVPVKSGGRGWAGLVGLGLLGMLFVSMLCCCITVFWTREGEAELVSRSWERSIAIERFSARSDGDWCDGMPHDAYGVSRSQKQRSTNRIPDGEVCRTVNRDNGDGTYSQSQSCTTTYREEPVYDDWCSYTVDRWGHDRWETAKGTGKDKPKWPRISVDGCRSLGCTREGSRVAHYTLHLREVGGDGDADCQVTEAQWTREKKGRRQTVAIGVIDGGIRCSSWE